MEVILSWTLRTGVLFAAVLMTLGFFIDSVLILFGTVILMLTPLMRVILGGICFLSQREKQYFVFALYVISVLIIGIFIKV